MQLSSLLDLGNGYSLKELAEEARKENTAMRKLTERSTKDAAAVKVLTMITLIYLPATVVSVRFSIKFKFKLMLMTWQNFFSTEFVGQKQRSSGSMEVVVSSNAWLFAAISVPLTLCTVLIWWAWTRFQTIQDRRRNGNSEISPLRRVLTQRLNPSPLPVEDPKKYHEVERPM